MTEMYEEPEGAPVASGPSRRGRALVLTGVVLVVALFALTGFARFYTDRLWFDDLGYGSVFSRLLWTRIGLFAFAGLLMAAAVTVNIVIAFRSRPLFVSMPGQDNLDRYRESLTPIRKPLLIGIAFLLLVFAGTSGASQWRQFLLWRNGVDFGTKDQYFNKDIGFFVFDLPWLHYVTDLAMAMLVVSIFAAALTHYLYAGIRLQAPGERLTSAAQIQLSVLIGLFLVVKAVDYWLDRYDLVSQSGGLVTGVTYTDDNAVLPAKNILFGIALICAVLFFLNVWRRTWTLPSVGAALMALSAILLGLIVPGIVQQFQVKPSEADKEEPYIAKNITATREAYDLTDVEVEPYADASSSTTEGDLAQLTSQLNSVPLVDPLLVRRAFEQQQQARAYYSVAPVLDVDRYDIDGTDRAMVVAARELDQSGINEAGRNWTNLHTVYTHGDGLIAAYANQLEQDDTTTPTEGIAWAEGIGPGEDQLSTATGGYQSQIYFGENSPDYSIVGKASASSPDVELGLTDANTQTERQTTYNGLGGVSIGSTFRQLMYAIKFGEPNFLLSGRVNPNSQVIYDRDPAERVKKVAPWLTLDSDAYPTVVDGKILWVVDGYTTTDRYPGSEKESFATMTRDSRPDTTGLQPPPTDEINYMRNAVKATVDAYDGTVTIYAWDESDPILQTWEKAFPNVVVPKDAIPADLLPHLRYPDDLFKVQRYQLARYHVTNASDFYTDRNRWEVPLDPNDSTNNALQPPYRLFSQATPGDGAENTWSLTSVFVPFGKSTLAAYLSVDSDATDAANYGKMQVLEIPGQSIDGPANIANRIGQDPDVRNRLLRYSSSTNPPLYGNLLTLPVDNGLIYVEPIYAVTAGSETGYPILQYVTVVYGDNVGIGRTLGQAIADVLGASASTGGDTGGDSAGDNGNGDGGDNGGDVTGTINQRIRQLLADADDAFAAANKALENGKLGVYQKQVKTAQNLVQQALTLSQQRDSASASGSGSATSGQPSSSPSASPSASPSDTASSAASGE